MNPRVMTLRKNNVPIVGLRDVSIEWSGGSIDITAGEDNGKKRLLDVSSEESITINASGVALDEVFREIVLGGTTRLFTDMDLQFYDLAQLTADMRISSYAETATYKDAVSFSLTLEVSGQWIYTPVA